jgi:hypothetical protein
VRRYLIVPEHAGEPSFDLAAPSGDFAAFAAAIYITHPAYTHVAVGYNVQIAVDAKHKLIVEQQVTNQDGLAAKLSDAHFAAPSGLKIGYPTYIPSIWMAIGCQSDGRQPT